MWTSDEQETEKVFSTFKIEMERESRSKTIKLMMMQSVFVWIQSSKQKVSALKFSKFQCYFFSVSLHHKTADAAADNNDHNDNDGVDWLREISP